MTPEEQVRSLDEALLRLDERISDALQYGDSPTALAMMRLPVWLLPALRDAALERRRALEHEEEEPSDADEAA